MKVVLAALLLLGCATSRIPAALRGYDVVVEGKDEESVELARALQAYGVPVRRQLRGGSGPTAALIHFTFGLPGQHAPTFFHVRLADTRSGVIVRAGTIALDSTATTIRARASAAVRALMAGDSALPNP
ncbi:MAG: hypothetical protein ABR537_11770 [Gemmatimonadales bacterium]